MIHDLYEGLSPILYHLTYLNNATHTIGPVGFWLLAIVSTNITLYISTMTTNVYRHVLMGDTDSTYVRLDRYADQHDIEKNDVNMVCLADSLQVMLQDALPSILSKKFLAPESMISILEPGREIVGKRGLFKDVKKRYAIHIINSDGKPVDKLKVMGMETRRSDTPIFIQGFLYECLNSVVKYNLGYDDIKKLVDRFRIKFREMDPWRIGSPGRVNNLSTKSAIYTEWLANQDIIGNKKPLLHITVSAAINTNRLMDIHKETQWPKLLDGDKVEVIYLKDNIYAMKSVAILTGIEYVPDWFKELPFDILKMEEKLLDKKLFNIIGHVLNWEFKPDTTYANEITVEDDFYA